MSRFCSSRIPILGPTSPNISIFDLDILLSGTKGKPAFRKSSFYFKLGPHTGLAAESDPEKHRIIRKWMAPAFAPRALKEQDPVLHRVVDNAVNKMALKGDTPEGFDMTVVSYFHLFNNELNSLSTHRD